MTHRTMRVDRMIAPPGKLPWYRKLGMQVLLFLAPGIAAGLAVMAGIDITRNGTPTAHAQMRIWKTATCFRKT